AKPDYIGFVFWPRSKRNVTPDEALEMRRAADGDIKSVGVFVDADPAFIGRLYEAKAISVAQLHGNEDDAYITDLKEAFPGLEVWKAIQVHGRDDIEKASSCPADFVLLDAAMGSGRTF
ncbi:MAG: phosphoribosylanthranilate isomerase, partial [Eggerthellaceae bacterium]|nr:phosphoribosylanthranilate isomerase [Eggerthellaceae bacterium]